MYVVPGSATTVAGGPVPGVVAGVTAAFRGIGPILFRTPLKHTIFALDPIRKPRALGRIVPSRQRRSCRLSIVITVRVSTTIFPFAVTFTGVEGFLGVLAAATAVATSPASRKPEIRSAAAGSAGFKRVLLATPRTYGSMAGAASPGHWRQSKSGCAGPQ